MKKIHLKPCIIVKFNRHSLVMFERAQESLRLRGDELLMRVRKIYSQPASIHGKMLFSTGAILHSLLQGERCLSKLSSKTVKWGAYEVLS